MTYEIEKEFTFLLKNIPEIVRDWKIEYMRDVYIPKESLHPQIRLRQRGHMYFLTKKTPLREGDTSEMKEETIHLTEQEFKFFDESMKGKELEKNRYSSIENDLNIEIDEYLGDLKPLIVMDIEWKFEKPTQEIISKFDIVREITDEYNLAAGMLAGKKYNEIEKYLKI